MSHHPGAMQKCYLVRCGRCRQERIVRAGAQRVAAKQVRAVGWSLSKARGWICRACINKLQQEKAQLIIHALIG